jgi:hypothetical protein
VDVDEARRDVEARGVDGPAGAGGRDVVDAAHPHDAPAADADVGAVGRQARPVDDGPAPHDQVERGGGGRGGGRRRHGSSRALARLARPHCHGRIDLRDRRRRACDRTSARRAVGGRRRPSAQLCDGAGGAPATSNINASG